MLRTSVSSSGNERLADGNSKAPDYGMLPSLKTSAFERRAPVGSSKSRGDRDDDVSRLGRALELVESISHCSLALGDCLAPGWRDQVSYPIIRSARMRLFSQPELARLCCPAGDRSNREAAR